ncbi:7757_t:CDS:2 [Cetraspora pellucida]|uniref:7757_t:CDS:1 n=1 Tax=Cetraspora pellucida TaxID=1433469 RepID=A0ACA9LW16_9GLOM|nr:7757_t:CDS:2 [Cetraspora pellucida]
MWQQEFFNLKQETNTVNIYIAQFKKLQRKVAIPNDLATAITHARYCKIEKAMTTSEKNYVNDITKQLAQLYINSVMT